MPGLSESITDLAKLAVTSSGLTDAMESLEKLLKGDVIGAFMSLVKSMIKQATFFSSAALGIQKFVSGLAESRRYLSQYNGAIASAYLKLDVQRRMLNIRTGQNTQGSTTGLVDALAELNEAVQPMKEDLMTVVNGLGIVAAKVGTLMATVSKYLPVMILLKAIAEKIEENTRRAPAQLPAWEVLRAMQGGGGQPFGQRPPLPRINP